MKGIVLAGGLGSRLYPCTRVTNKHLLPVYDQPMIYYPLQTLAKAGCRQVMVVTGGENPGDFMRLIGDGKQFGFDAVYYTYQHNPTGGIADALRLTRQFIGSDKFCVVLGDNLILDDVRAYVDDFKLKPLGSACVFIKEIENPVAFGVAEVKGQMVTKIIEKPAVPATNLAVVGVYLYDGGVFDIIDKTRPSARGELEITTVNQVYADRGQLGYYMLKEPWLDTGSFQSLAEAQRIIADRKSL